MAGLMGFRTAFLAAALLVAMVLLWIFPGVVFPHPATNDAIWMSDLELPLILVTVIGVVVAAAAIRGMYATAVRVGLGVLLVGSGIDMVVGLARFGNLQDDRFLPLLLLPVLLGMTGVVALAIGLGVKRGPRQELMLGAALGLAGAIMVAVWTLVRGARDWLLAPYGFDIVVLVALCAAAILLLVVLTRTRAA